MNHFLSYLNTLKSNKKASFSFLLLNIITLIYLSKFFNSIIFRHKSNKGDKMTKQKLLKLSLGVSTILFLGMSQISFANGSGEKNINKLSETTSQATSWITTRVPYDISAKELAQNYYGDENDYQIIVNANKGIIGKNLMFKKNTEVKIPVTEKFRDQPEIIGWN